jgi:lipoprotein-anchoring transpeptidase ErfK/SrfK
MDRLVAALSSGIALFLLGSAAPLASSVAEAAAEAPIVVPPTPVAAEPPPKPVEPPPPPPPPTPAEALAGGVLIVVSIPSQKMYVFKDGEAWDSTAVSTGKPGNDTPTGVFPILQKKVHHRSSLYDDAPMPYMQRLTWDGIALHAGRVPGYPASHGCIRLPKDFARKLYGITRFNSTIVMVAEEEIGSVKEARKLV